MANELDTQTAPFDTGRKLTKYAVLKEIRVPLEGVEVEAWIVVANTEAKDGPSAIRNVAVMDDEVKEGRYVAIAESGFQPRTVRQMVKLSMD